MTTPSVSPICEDLTILNLAYFSCIKQAACAQDPIMAMRLGLDIKDCIQLSKLSLHQVTHLSHLGHILFSLRIDSEKLLEKADLAFKNTPLTTASFALLSN